MHESSLINSKLIVQPVFISLMHKHEFMGPCRYGCGEELSYAYDKKMAEKDLKLFNEDINQYIDARYVQLLEPKFIEWHEDFAVPNAAVNNAIEKNNEIDVYLISGTRLISYVSTILAKKTGKPLAFCPLSSSKYSRLGGIDATAHMKALGFKEMYNALTYDDLNQTFRILRVRKALRNTKLLYALRNNVLSFGCVSSFINLQDITDRFGMEILNYNGLEFFKIMDEFTEAEDEEARIFAEKLALDAHGVHMPAENIIKDVRFYLAVNKVLQQYECNAFTIPCFEMCATLELNKRHLTFCLTNSLLKDEGIPAACAADVGSVISLAILMNLTRKAPHMGNCMVRVQDLENNTMRILHDVCSRRMKGYDEPDLPIDYVSFTKGNWGATMRYDFSQDTGDIITMINMSPRMDKIMIAKGTIIGCDDFLTQECRHAVVFKVENSRDFHKKEEDFGHHFAWVYGDYQKDLIQFAELMGIEPVLA
ncbi:hypothetical protein EII17_06215 [Clostridiales bacterium COT073_COT-073]|nr:hypothetical protein EII17_06215 [Clostridiales bacterium COT073_COT-073]